jgi:hypothetical protein
MFGSETLEVAIGLVLVFFIMSLLCSTVTEWISRVLALRAKTLKDGIYKLINNDENLKNNIFNHPLFKGLSSKVNEKGKWWDSIKIGNWWIFKKRDDGPSALPAGTFSLILFDTLIDAEKTPGDGYKEIAASSKVKDDDIKDDKSKSLFKTSQKVVETLEAKIDSLDNQETKQVLRAFLTTAKTKVNNLEGVVAEFRTSIEKWFDDSQERVTGWYKRKSQLIVLGLALVLCFSLNVDSFGIANSLFNDSALRSTVVAAAEAKVEQSVSTDNTSELTFSELRDELYGLNLPIGWTSETEDPNRIPDSFWGWLLKIVGILITAFAVSLGATFWFDLLGKLVNMRAAGKKPDTTEEISAKAGTG